MVNQVTLSNKLIDWYDKHARKLPWRISPSDSRQGIKPDPYKVWVSEIMLQQTTVQVVETHFFKFIHKWPSVYSLKKATESEILTQWSGLGYYRRAMNLKACTDIICEKYNGNFPKNERHLLELPGIGKYTAAAILSIAYGIPSIVVDGNVERIIARLYEIKGPLNKSKSLIHKKMQVISPNKRPGDFAQAMMDLGATICKPANTKCSDCPIQIFCNAKKNDTTSIFPERVKRKRKVLRKGYVYLGITKSDKIALIFRPKSGLLAGLISPPTSEWKIGKYPDNIPPIPGTWTELDKIVKHAFSHFDLELRVMFSKISYVPKNYFLKPFKISITNSLPSVMKKVVILGLEKS